MYNVKTDLKPSGLVGISDNQINDHWKLYEGYVKQVNLIISDRDSQHRYGFEYNGMVLHEYYFENLTPNGKELPDGELKKSIASTWGSFENWKQDFIKTGKTRGIGWAILCIDPSTKKLINIFISGHEKNHIAGFKPLLVMDVWEHAYMVDHKAGGRGNYIEAFFANINWEIVEGR
jgi:Fe-Mn family superoxide dismutase